MRKIFFPYNNQPKEFSLKIKAPIRFPVYIGDLKYEWEIGASGITLYLYNGKIDSTNPVKSNVFSDANGIMLNLISNTSKAKKSIYIEFSKIGQGLHDITTLDPFFTDHLDEFTLDILDSFRFGMIDPLPHSITDKLTLGELDAFTLGDMVRSFADWMTLSVSSTTANTTNYIKASECGTRLKNADDVTLNNEVFAGNLTSKIAVTDLKNERYMILGELDSKTLMDIDTMAATFKIFDRIPAYLVKGIHITDENMLVSKVNNLSTDKHIIANGIHIKLGNNVLPLTINTSTENNE